MRSAIQVTSAMSVAWRSQVSAIAGALWVTLGLGCAATTAPLPSDTAGTGSPSARDASAGAPADGRDSATAAADHVSPPSISGPVMLASGQHAPAAIAVDRENVYWFNLGTNDTTDTKAPRPWMNGQVMKCAIAGCGNKPTPLATGRTMASGTVVPLAFATDGQNVYWSDVTSGDWPWALLRCSVAGCDDSPSVIIPELATAIAVYASKVYWTAGNGAVSTCHISGCGVPTSLWSPSAPALAFGIAVDSSGVYWAGEPRDQVFKCGLDGCATHPTELNPIDTEVAALGQVAIDAENVYFVDGNPLQHGMILKCPKSGCSGSSTALANGLSSPRGIASDGIHVYWAEAESEDTVVDGRVVRGAGYVRKCAVAGCNNAPTTIASGVNWPAAIAVDDAFVYWTAAHEGDGDGEIWMAPK
jgi:hypothetical protein